MKLLIYIYSILAYLLFALLYFVSFFSKSVREQIKIRKLDKSKLIDIARKRSTKDSCVLFFCSSAGEYEQAKPIINRILKLDDVFVYILFFSKSGIKFAKSRNETLEYSICPIDLRRNWKAYFKVLKPSVTVVVRHELWPNFLLTAKTYGKLFLIDASINNKRPLSILIKKMLFPLFDKIFLVDQSDTNFMESIITSSRIVKTGDSKYDRVVERAKEKSEDIFKLEQTFSKSFNATYRFIVGSAWEPDTRIVLDAFKEIEHLLQKMWQVIIAPHNISDRMINLIKDECSSRSLSYFLFSNLDKEIPDPSTNVLIVDTMGRLSEIYGCANLCLVGGALHNKIHNVLEPAALGVPLSFGPKYNDQKEAVNLHNEGLAQVIKNPFELGKWWIDKEATCDVPDGNMLKYIHKLCGASDIIFELILIHLHKKSKTK